MFKCASEGPDLRSGTRHPRPPEAAGGRPGWVIGLPEARWITPQPLCHCQPCVPCRRRLSTLLKARSGREGRKWHHFCQLEENLSQFARPTDQVVEVFHLIDGEDSRRRVLCPWRAHPLASTLPAVARATAGKVLARGCARQGQSIRRRLSSPSMRWNTSATWLVDRAVWQSSSSSCRSWHQPRPSRPDMALSSGDSLRPQGAQG